MIPRKLHVIWVGNESLRPNRLIRTWQHHHPGWEFRIWGNEELHGRPWINHAHMRAMAHQEWAGVADMMRWEILLAEGGVVVDADSICVRALPDWMLECEAFACWENEFNRPGLIATGYFGSAPGNPFLARLVEDIRRQPTVTDRMAWQSTGPLRLTESWKAHRYENLTILPSHFFIPRHFTGSEYTGPGPVFARQEWGSTLNCYDSLADGALRPGEAFLCQVDWRGVAWVEPLLSYLDAFAPDDPVALVLLPDPAAPAVPREEAEAILLSVVQRTGRERIPEVFLAGAGRDLLGILRRYPRATWVPPGRGATEGFRGVLGARFAAARQQMAKPEPSTPLP